MSLLRIIARLDIKGKNVVKGIGFEGLRIMGEPNELACKYAEEADEILYIDSVSSLYGRNQLGGLLEKTSESVFIPITVAGGIRSIADAQRLFGSGADKVAINTGAIKDPNCIDRIASRFGSQAIVVSIEAKRQDGFWECYTDNGRERTGRCALEWAREAVDRGAGEVLITSVDRDGTKKGFDVELFSELDLPVPIVACGGMGTIEHAKEVLKYADAIACASVLHYNLLTIGEIRGELDKK